MATHQKPFIVPVFIPHSGCPHRCVFCNQAVITGTRRSLPTAEAISLIIERFLSYKRENRSHAEVSFYGGNFLGLPAGQVQRLLDATASFVRAGRVDSLRFSTRPDTIDKDRLDLIRPYPVSTIELGAQSMADRVLELADRGHTAEDTCRAVKLLKKEGYQVGLQMMIGLPGDTRAGERHTVQKIISLSPDFVRIYPTLVLEGSPLAIWYRQGRYTPLSLDECIAQVKSMYLLLRKHNIPVIRMGLQATEELDDSAVVLAGPYHPSLGHMALSAILLDRAMECLDAVTTTNNTVTLFVHPKSLSRMQGLNKRNLNILKQEYHIRSLQLKTDSRMAEDAVRAVIGGE